MSDDRQAPTTDDAVRAAHRSLGQLPGLDGLRAIGVVSVAVGHASMHAGTFSLMHGVFFAISLFFTLSGFLITSLLLLELEHGDTIRIGSFWSRRFRRLVPASLVGIIAVLLYGWFAADAHQRENLFGDVAAALTYMTNWRQLFEGQVYANQLGSPTPLLHYWSLAIEEQFYVGLPLVLLAAHRLGRGSRHAIPAALGLLSVASLGAIALLVTSEGVNPDRLYYGTDARAVEFLVGGLLAVWFTRNRAAAAQHTRTLDVLGWVGAGATFLLWVSADLTDEWIYEGGMLVAIIPSLALVLGAASGGTLSRLLSVRPLRAVGRVSYGMYVLHWPVILWMTPERTGVDARPLLVVQLGVVYLLALLSHELLEDPIRRRQLLRSRRAAMSAAVIASVLLLAASWPTAARGPASEFDIEELQRQLDETLAGTADESGIRVGFFGDSTAVVLSVGTWAAEADDDLVPAGSSMIGSCGVTGTPDVLINDSPHFRGTCDLWPDRWTEVLEERPADIAIITTPSDVFPASVDGGPYHSLEDPEGSRHLLEQMLRAVDVLTEAGAHVVWIKQPQVVFGVVDGVEPVPPWPESDVRLMDRYNELVDQLAEQRPDDVDALDLGAYLTSLPGGVMDRRLRPDLLHLSANAAAQVARDWLRPQLEAIAERRGIERHETPP